MATGHSQPPAFLLSKPVPTQSEAEARARKLARLEALANHLRSAAADCPAGDAELKASIAAAATAAMQLASYLKRQEPVADQIERLTAERRSALDAMRAAGSDMGAFNAACKREADLAYQIRQLRRQGGAK